ncbi:zinc finger protein [Angomonas deanei]|nr:zinc finger protein [Angomonas deanei]|eukprot:EPY39457.1 zinc finger protein [Angomonas deanei]
MCGNIFCHTCCDEWVILKEIHPSDPQRICSECHRALHSSQQNSAVRGRMINASTPFRVNVPSKGNAASSIHSSEEEGDETCRNGVAEVISSMDESRHCNSISFLPVLSGNLVSSDAENVLNVLLFATGDCFTVNVITFEDNETMEDLVCRLSESFYKLRNGPFKTITEEEQKLLLSQLRFSTDTQYIDKKEKALAVASSYRNVILSTLSLEDIDKFSRKLPGTDTALSDFFNPSAFPVC